MRCRSSLYKTAGAIGLFGDGFDAEYGGHGQRDALMRLVLMEELCRSGSGGVVAALFSNYIGLPPIQKFGSDEIKARVITPCQSGDAIAALAITEPSGGSDVARIRTTARRDGDEFVVNGSEDVHHLRHAGRLLHHGGANRGRRPGGVVDAVDRR